MARLGVPRLCARCGATVEWSLDRHHDVVLIESASRAAHVCPKRLLAAWVRCICGATICRYADGSTEQWPTRQPHVCGGVWAGWNDPPAASA